MGLAFHVAIPVFRACGPLRTTKGALEANSSLVQYHIHPFMLTTLRKAGSLARVCALVITIQRSTNDKCRSLRLRLQARGVSSPSMNTSQSTC